MPPWSSSLSQRMNKHSFAELGAITAYIKQDTRYNNTKKTKNNKTKEDKNRTNKTNTHKKK